MYDHQTQVTFAQVCRRNGEKKHVIQELAADLEWLCIGDCWYKVRLGTRHRGTKASSGSPVGGRGDSPGGELRWSSRNSCGTRHRALLLPTSSRVQLWHSRQPFVVAAVPFLKAGQAVVSRGRAVYKKQNSSSSNVGSVKTVVGVGYYLRTYIARVVNIVSDRQRSQQKNPSHSGLKEKPQTATTSHSEPLKSHRVPLLEQEKASHFQHFATSQGLWTLQNAT